MSKQYTSHSSWPTQQEIARDLRIAATDGEAALWNLLRNRRLLGLKFRRQHRIGQFIVDFYCVETALVIEVDGEIHDHQKERDRLRQEFLESRGLRVLRLTNEEVLHDRDSIRDRLMILINQVGSESPSPRRGEGVAEGRG